MTPHPRTSSDFFAAQGSFVSDLFVTTVEVTLISFEKSHTSVDVT